MAEKEEGEEKSSRETSEGEKEAAWIGLHNYSMGYERGSAQEKIIKNSEEKKPQKLLNHGRSGRTAEENQNQQER